MNNNLWEHTLLNNSLKSWAIAFAITAASFVILRLLRRIFVIRLKSFADKTVSTLDDIIVDVVGKSIMPILYVLAIHFGLQYLTLPKYFLVAEHAVLMIVITFFFIRIIVSFLRYSFHRAFLKNEKNEYE